MAGSFPFEVGGYVLAGGRSSRMGREKALIPLGGIPLIEHAVKKLRRVCKSVCALSANPELEQYAPLVRDLHPDCGPIGGLEAALAHSLYDWNVFLAIDMPFLPTAYIRMWMDTWMPPEMEKTLWPGIRMLSVEDRPQPGFCLLHKEVGPLLTESIERREFKVMNAFEAATKELDARYGSRVTGLWNVPATGFEGPADIADRSATDWRGITSTQRAARALWFANLNTPKDLADAEAHIEALDT